MWLFTMRKLLHRSNIRFAFWNIEGLRFTDDHPKTQDETFITLVKSNDIIGIAETHCGESDSISVEGYNCFKLSRPKSNKINRHFGGIAVMYKTELKEGIKFLNHANNDYSWLKLNTELFGLDKDLYICIVYIPLESSPYYKVRQQDTLSFIEEDICNYSMKGSVVLAGDLNARQI